MAWHIAQSIAGTCRYLRRLVVVMLKLGNSIDYTYIWNNFKLYRHGENLFNAHVMQLTLSLDLCIDWIKWHWTVCLAYQHPPPLLTQLCPEILRETIHILDARACRIRWYKSIDSHPPSSILCIAFNRPSTISSQTTKRFPQAPSWYKYKAKLRIMISLRDRPVRQRILSIH